MINIQKILLSLFVILVITSCSQRWEIDNPYASVNWSTDLQYKGNLHTHTTNSDGRMNPQTVVDTYYELGYNFLAITDHNAVTWPWTAFSQLEPSTTSINRMESAPETMPDDLVWEDRDPAELGMIAIQANELSRHHHIGSFFNDHNGTITERESLDATAAKGGITMLYHPGRYLERAPETYTLEWYIGVYNDYDHLIGMEVYNQGDRYPYDRNLWDDVLMELMPDRPVWGYSNDDMHSLSQLGRNWTMMILPELSQESVRYGMENGLSYFVYAPQGHSGPEAPWINGITVNERRGTIEISGTGYNSISWIYGGEVVHTGNLLDLNQLEEGVNYVRAKLYGDGNTLVGTQPFGVRVP